jgi:hypothetical protein
MFPNAVSAAISGFAFDSLRSVAAVIRAPKQRGVRSGVRSKKILFTHNFSHNTSPYAVILSWIPALVGATFVFAGGRRS